jgi:hypothetical protein
MLPAERAAHFMTNDRFTWTVSAAATRLRIAILAVVVCVAQSCLWRLWAQYARFCSLL